MNNKTLQTIALRYHAIYLDIKREDIDMSSMTTHPVLAMVAKLKENGFCVTEELLHALTAVSVDELTNITGIINNVMGIGLNWAPLVKGWDIPTDESYEDHLITLIVNLLGNKKKGKNGQTNSGIKGTTLPCGHIIPDGTFPLERYNGCPFCGRQFKTANFVYKGQASKLKELRLFTDTDMKTVFNSLLNSSTPLDGTQRNSLQQLLSVYDIPQNITVGMKETAMFVVQTLIKQDKAEQACAFLKTPTDILRYLWFEKTGCVQIIKPKTLIAHANHVNFHILKPSDRGAEAAEQMKEKLSLKYNRKECRRVATWLNRIPMPAPLVAEDMHPKRGMWVRMIRALRLGEYSRRKGYEHLAEILDVFYKQEYTPWMGTLDKARMNHDAETTLRLLKQRPGLFSRCLFATMLRFGCDETLAAFNEITDKMPARLLLSLGNSAEIYFNSKKERVVRPITGGTTRVPVNKLLNLYTEENLADMAKKVNETYKISMKRHFAAVSTNSQSMYIDPKLFDIPVSVGDRTTTVQDTSCALMGTRFPIKGKTVRLFLQWGKGLPAQHLDMDLSCRIAFEDGSTKECAYYNLKTIGAKHSGDIRYIPDQVGTAEYIELDIPILKKHHAQYVTFTCNAYSCGTLSPNLVVGWMDSANPMKISPKTGVAYDPSCVQHMVRISESDLSKGLVFGVLDVKEREIIWLEMPFTNQTIEGCDSAAVKALLKRLKEKLSIGELLQLKAEAQHIEIVKRRKSADESYTYEWALNPAEVSLLLNT